jgi:hypothetical protein
MDRRDYTPTKSSKLFSTTYNPTPNYNPTPTHNPSNYNPAPAPRETYRFSS